MSAADFLNKKLSKIVGCVLMFSQLTACAAMAKQSCYQTEVHYQTSELFRTEAELSEELQRWQSRKPIEPGAFQQLQTWLYYKQHVSRANRYAKSDDKKKHCYVGCIISRYSGLEMAHYAGWKKELDDIMDCKKVTRFEPADLDATLKGADIGIRMNYQANPYFTPEDMCFDLCQHYVP